MPHMERKILIANLSTCGRPESRFSNTAASGMWARRGRGSGVRELWLLDASWQRLSLPRCLPTLQHLRIWSHVMSIFFPMVIIVPDTLKFRKAPVLDRGSHISRILESSQSNLLSLPKFVSRLLWRRVGLVVPQGPPQICLMISFSLRSEEH